MSALFYENYLNGLLKSMQECQNLIDEDIENEITTLEELIDKIKMKK